MGIEIVDVLPFGGRRVSRLTPGADRRGLTAGRRGDSSGATSAYGDGDKQVNRQASHHIPSPTGLASRLPSSNRPTAQVAARAADAARRRLISREATTAITRIAP